MPLLHFPYSWILCWSLILTILLLFTLFYVILCYLFYCFFYSIIFLLYTLFFIFIYAETYEQHIEHLQLVLHKLWEHQLIIKMPRCFLGPKGNLIPWCHCWQWNSSKNPKNPKNLIKYKLLEIGRCPKLKSKLNLLSSFVLTMISVFTISRILCCATNKYVS